MMKQLPLVISLCLFVACTDEPDFVEFCALSQGDSPSIGPEDAWVTIVEFSDFECLYCGSAQSVIDQMLNRFEGDVRLIFKHLPLSQHDRAFPAAAAAVCADEQDFFWEMHDSLFAHSDELEDADLLQYATEIGLNIEAFQECLDSNLPNNRVSSDAIDALRAGVLGTPTFFINGHHYFGSMPADHFEAAIQAALTEAQQSGTAQADYYQTLTELPCE